MKISVEPTILNRYYYHKGTAVPEKSTPPQVPDTEKSLPASNLSLCSINSFCILDCSGNRS